MMKHLEMHEIMKLAMNSGYHEHLDACAFCHEEYCEAIDLLKFESSASLDATDAEARVLNGHFQCRLAAQDSEESVAETHVRRTWYLEDGTAILRVMEDQQRGSLYGHLIIDPTRYATVTIRFNGIEGDFHPDPNGLFEIGSSAIEIERMDAILVEG